jgi:poly-gamma-glutamate capsule biosynthesis protein CapA/YwtB (metallophosphatase superfamily)
MRIPVGTLLCILLAGACEQDSEAPHVSQDSPQTAVIQSPTQIESAPQPRAPGPERKADELELTFVGDIIFGRYRDDEAFDPILETPGFDPFEQIRPHLRADVVVGNLETPIVEQLPERSPIDLAYRFAGSRELVRAHLGDFTVLSLANNHYFDLREAGQLESPEILADEGIFPIGAARLAAPLHRVETYRTKGWNIGFVAVTNRVNVPDRADGPQVPFIQLHEMPDTLLPIVERARAEHDLIVVVVHWGDEYLESPNMYQRDVARQLIEGGVDMVIGHHSHVLQAIEQHQGGLIAYSLGNFLFEYTDLAPRLTGVLRTRWQAAPEGAAASESTLSAAVFHPAANQREPDPHPAPATGELAEQVRARMVRLSAKLGAKPGSEWRPITGSEDLSLRLSAH